MNQKYLVRSFAACLAICLVACKDEPASRPAPRPAPVVADAAVVIVPAPAPTPVVDAGPVKPPSCASCQPGTMCVMMPSIGNVNGVVACVPLPPQPVIVPVVTDAGTTTDAQDASAEDVADASADVQDAATDAPADTNTQPDSGTVPVADAGPIMPAMQICQTCVSMGMACAPVNGSWACVPVNALPPVVVPVPVVPDAGTVSADAGPVDADVPQAPPTEPTHLSMLSVAHGIQGPAPVDPAFNQAAVRFCQVMGANLEAVINNDPKAPCPIGTTIGCFRRELASPLPTCVRESDTQCVHPAERGVPAWFDGCGGVTDTNPGLIVYQPVNPQATATMVGEALRPNLISR